MAHRNPKYRDTPLNSTPAICLLSALGLAVAVTASATTPGDVSEDDRFDAADALLLSRSLNGDLTLTPSAAAAADVSPLGVDGSLPDRLLNSSDLQILLRGLRGDNLDNDGLPGPLEQPPLSVFSSDSDSDGIADGFEDSDGDGLDDLQEVQLGTGLLQMDSDGDGTRDGEEDSDSDGLANFLELGFGTDLLSADSDGDSFPDGAEAAAGTDPTAGGDVNAPPNAPTVIFASHLYFPTQFDDRIRGKLVPAECEDDRLPADSCIQIVRAVPIGDDCTDPLAAFEANVDEVGDWEINGLQPATYYTLYGVADDGSLESCSAPYSTGTFAPDGNSTNPLLKPELDPFEDTSGAPLVASSSPFLLSGSTLSTRHFHVRRNGVRVTNELTGGDRFSQTEAGHFDQPLTLLNGLNTIEIEAIGAGGAVNVSVPTHISYSVPSTKLHVAAPKPTSGAVTLAETGDVVPAGFSIRLEGREEAPSTVSFAVTSVPSAGISISHDLALGISLIRDGATATPLEVLATAPGTYVITLQATLVETNEVRSDTMTIVVTDPAGPPSPEALAPIAAPEAIPPNQASSVTFRAAVVGPGEPFALVELQEVDPSGTTVLATVGPLADDGVAPDYIAGDSGFAGTFTMGPIAAGSKKFFRTRVVTAQGDVFSQPAALVTSTFPPFLRSSTPSTPVIDEEGVRYIGNQVLVRVAVGTPDSEISAIAGGVGGSVIGSNPSVEVFQFEVPPQSSLAGLHSIVSALIADPRVEHAEAISFAQPLGVKLDQPHWAPKKIRIDESLVTERGNLLR